MFPFSGGAVNIEGPNIQAVYKRGHPVVCAK
jgi:hypothetical protein